MPAKCFRSELIGLLGCPVDENPTVVIMEAAFKALGIDYRYNTIMVKPQDLELAIKALKAYNMKGTHITIPHKTEVLKYLDIVADDAKLMGAVNTIYLRDGMSYGENTDGKGFMVSLRENDVPTVGKYATVLGAGGAARAISVELAMAGIAHIDIVNIEKDMGLALVDILNDKTPVSARFIHWDGAYSVSDKTDILVNATSVGLYPDTSRVNIDYSSMHERMVVCDVIPNPPLTGFLKEAMNKGCKSLDGFGMLVNQGAISFKLWTGCDAPVDVMREALASEFNVEI